MAGLRKRTWKTAKGITTRYELSFVDERGIQRKVLFKKKPTPEEIFVATKTKSGVPTLKEAIDSYIKVHCSINCKESTKETYSSYVHHFGELLYKKVNKIKKQDIETFIMYKKEILAHKTINNILMFLRGVLNECIDNKIILENPTRKIKALPVEDDKVKTLSENQIIVFEQLLDYCPLWVKTFFVLLLYTGMRISECIALEWTDIEIGNNSATIKINKQYYRKRITSTKNYEQRTIDIPSFVVAVIVEYKKSLKVLSKQMFVGRTGGYISVSNIRERWFALLKNKVEEILNENLSDITPHCLRHTHATTLLSNGIPLKYVSERLGHKDAETTLNIYNHVLNSDKYKAIEFMEKQNRAKIERNIKSLT